MPEVAIVTGGGRGIGAAIARSLAATDIRVGVLDLDANVAAEVAAEIDGLAIAADVTDSDSLGSAFARAAAELGDPTVLVNNAGLIKPGMLHRMSDVDWDVVHEVGLRGAFNAFRAIAPYFRVRDDHGRRVVNIASISGVAGNAGGANYAAAKGGVIALTKSMAIEWAPFGVTVNAVAPGVIDTRLSAPLEPGEAAETGIPASALEEAISRVPLGRIGTPEDVASAVSYFVSRGASYVTGQVLEVHGGLSQLVPRI
jgi:3-oxoacyl-[acyl-carrier protein] reductase